jgi:hypothetical protein
MEYKGEHMREGRGGGEGGRRYHRIGQTTSAGAASLPEATIRPGTTMVAVMVDG